MGWNRVHTALHRCSSAHMLTKEKMRENKERRIQLCSLHKEKIFLLCNLDQLVQLFNFETSRLFEEDMFTSQKSIFCVTVVKNMRGAYVDGCDILFVRVSTSIRLIVTLKMSQGYVQDRYTLLRKYPSP